MPHDTSLPVPAGFVAFSEPPRRARPLPPTDGNAPPAPEAWPEMDASLIEEVRGAVPPFPMQVLPPLWNDWVYDTAQATGTPFDYVAQGLLAAVMAVCGAGVSVQVTPSWREPMVLWQALVGEPSSGKSPALAAVRRQLSEIEHKLREGDGERRARHTAALAESEHQRERWDEQCAAAIARGERVPDPPAALLVSETFAPSQIIVADATVEALADVVAGNPRGVILWRDELAAWLSNQGRYANGGSDRAHWLEAWSAASITVNRRSREQPLTLAKFPVSIIGTIQPDRIAESFAGADDGLAARFLYAWPDLPDYTSLWDRRLADDDTALALLDRIAGAAGTPDAPLRLAFDRDAVEMFDLFLRGVSAEARTLEGLEAGWMGKGAGTVARLAGALALLVWSESKRQDRPAEITLDVAQNAALLWSSYFRPHARAVFNQAGRSDRDRHARRLVRWLRTGRIEVLSREAVRREALCYAVDADGADRVIARLVTGGFLRLMPRTRSGSGRPTRRWAVNPALFP